ncbi:glycosyl hydrolase [Micromonospora sp. M12]
MANSRAGWYYTWGTQHPGISTPGCDVRADDPERGERQRHGAGSGQAAGPHLLTFNEPDLPAQANMTVEQALDLWPQVMATGSKLGSPAVAWGAPDPQGWLDRFMTGAQARGQRVDFVTLHWFGADFTTPTAVDQLRRYLQAVYQRYRKPIWLTEFALIRFDGGGSHFPSQEQQAAFHGGHRHARSTLLRAAVRLVRPALHRQGPVRVVHRRDRGDSGRPRVPGRPLSGGGRMDEHRVSTRSAVRGRAARIVGVVATLVATALAVGLTQGWGRTDHAPETRSVAPVPTAAVPTAPVVLNGTDDAFIQLLIPMNEGALALIDHVDTRSAGPDRRCGRSSARSGPRTRRSYGTCAGCWRRATSRS